MNQAAIAPSTATAVPAAPAAASGALLLVDDEPSVLSALRRLFRLQGYQIEQATGGVDALKLMQAQHFDLVISDMRMPEMDGAAFLEQVRQHHPDCVRLLLTGYSDIASTVAAINRGEIHRYIAKPWDDNDLLLVVREALERRALERENRDLLALTRQQNQDLQALNHSLEDKVAERTQALELSNQQLQQAHADVQAQFTMAVTVFSGLLEMRQNGIAGHARRVAELARRMAIKLGQTEAQQRDVHLAALLHDIGKLGFDDEMLGKPVSKYGPEDIVRYHQHPLDGEAALMPLDKLHGVALIVRQHHERVDGRGFPDGLYGPHISMGAKIVATASDYDGLTSGGAAEFVYTGDKACQAIRDNIGTHYEMRVANALFEVVAEMEKEQVQEVEMEVTALKPRMQLSRDLLSTQGAVLLPAGFKFDAVVIKKVCDFAARTNIRLVVSVLLKSIEPAAPGATGGAAVRKP